MQDVRAILFDKDGTLFDFRASWSAWTRTVLDDLAPGDAIGAGRLAELLGYDLEAGEFARDSVLIAGSLDEIAGILVPHLPGTEVATLGAYLGRRAGEARMRAAVPLRPLLSGLVASGLRIGLATNDAEAAARSHLHAAGVLDLFHHVAGYDSGHRPKPAPDMLLAFATAQGLPAASVVMVGDSAHDLVAARSAGMRAVAVLTGIAGPEELAPLADHLLPDIGHLPGLLGLSTA